MPDTCVIYNPAAGRGRAKRAIEQARLWAAPTADLWPSESAGHAVELAKRASLEGFRRVIAAGGDGTAHEVVNGLLQSGRTDVIFGMWPLGSANDYGAALQVNDWFFSKGTRGTLTTKPIDVARVRSGMREMYSVNCLGVGFNGMVTIEARNIRRLRGMPLYTLAFLKAMLWRFETPTLSISWDDATHTTPTLSASFNIGIREGGFPITKAAKLDDGLLNCVHVGDMRRWELVRYLPALMTGNLPLKHPKLRTGTCRIARIVGTSALCVHADGEFFCRPEDDVREMTVEVVPGRLLAETGN